MKHYILLGLSTLGLLTTQVRANECKFREVPLSGKTYVIPVYKANANFVFNKEERSAFAQVTWGLDEEATKKCFSEAEERFPLAKLLIPTVRMDELTVNVLGGGASIPLHVIQQSNGHWAGMADLIKISYRSKNEITQAIDAGEKVISIMGDLRYRMTEIERKNVGKTDCTLKNEEAGVLKLYKRMGEIKSLLEKRNPAEGVNKEEVMQDFLGTCVRFMDVDSEGLASFDSAQRVNSKILKGVINIKGNVAKETTEALTTVGTQNASVMDI